jgi:23S rRNA maturation mini-RNase III
MRKASVALVGAGYSKTANTLGLYAVIENLDGFSFLWDANFTHLVRYALTTFCVSEMTVLQKELLQQYVAAVNQEIAHTDVTLSLDEHLTDIAQCVDNSTEVIVCGNADLHTYVACGVDINL